MLRIGVRELRQHASRYLARVRAGETVEVTDRGVLVALLVPPGPGESSRQELIAAGMLDPAAAPLEFPRRPRLASSSASALDDVRDDRL
jgi:prevent-host-death family protein